MHQFLCYLQNQILYLLWRGCWCINILYFFGGSCPVFEFRHYELVKTRREVFSLLQVAYAVAAQAADVDQLILDHTPKVMNFHRTAILSKH